MEKKRSSISTSWSNSIRGKIWSKQLVSKSIHRCHLCSCSFLIRKILVWFFPNLKSCVLPAADDEHREACHLLGTALEGIRDKWLDANADAGDDPPGKTAAEQAAGAKIGKTKRLEAMSEGDLPSFMPSSTFGFCDESKSLPGMPLKYYDTNAALAASHRARTK